MDHMLRNIASGPELWLPGRILSRSDSSREPLPAEGRPQSRLLSFPDLESGRNPARNPDLRPRNNIAKHKVNICPGRSIEVMSGAPRRPSMARDIGPHQTEQQCLREVF